MEEKQTSSGLAPAERKHHDPEAFCPDLEWLLIAGDSAMGERGSLGGVIAQLEHGGPFTGVPSTDLYSDQQVGFGKTVVGLVERHRWLMLSWNSLGVRTRAILILCYQAPRAEYRSDGTMGSRSGTDAQLGRYAALALMLTDEPGPLLQACHEPQKGKHNRVIARELRKAKEQAVSAHEEWKVAKGASGKPRMPSERRKVMPEFVPAVEGE